MHYIFGLGNPGDQYTKTRHNVGRALVTDLATAQNAKLEKDRGANALVATGSIGQAPIAFVLPETFMNRSGETAAYFMAKHAAKPEDIIVVHDEVDLPLGTVRIATERGDGGHNGIKSMIEGTKGRGFIRVRIGISPTSFWTGKVKRPQGGGALEKFVLGPFSRAESSVIADIAPSVWDAIEMIVTHGREKAMNRFNA